TEPDLRARGEHLAAGARRGEGSDQLRPLRSPAPRAPSTCHAPATIPGRVVPDRHDDDLVLDALPADERHRGGTKERAGLRGDRVEPLRLRAAGGDEHCDVPREVCSAISSAVSRRASALTIACATRAAKSRSWFSAPRGNGRSTSV